MIRVRFYGSGETLKGFELSGHAGYAKSGKDIVCAAVSSAVQLTMNILGGLGYEPDVTIGDNVIRCGVSGSGESSAILGIFREHLEAVLEEFPGTIKIPFSEV